MVSDSTDRGQLLLVGALVIAVVIVGVAVVVNTVLFTENVETATANDQLSETAEIDFEIRRSVRSTTIRVNHRSTDYDANAIASQVESNISHLDAILRESYVSSQSLSVGVDYDNSSSELGGRVVQDEDDPLVNPSGDSEWVPVQNHRIGWFVLNLNITESSTDPVYANVSNDDGAVVNITLNKTDTIPPEVEVTSSVDGGPKTTVSCTPRNGRVLLDVRSGESYTDDSCTFAGTSSIPNVSTVRIENGDNAVGTYSIVANDTGSVSGAGTTFDECASTLDTPCLSPVVWTANVTTTVGNEEITFQNSHNVSVYGVVE